MLEEERVQLCAVEGFDGSAVKHVFYLSKLGRCMTSTAEPR